MGEAQSSGSPKQDAPDCGDQSKDGPTLQSHDWQDQASLGKGQLDQRRNHLYESQSLEEIFWLIGGTTNVLEKAA